MPADKKPKNTQPPSKVARAAQRRADAWADRRAGMTIAEIAQKHEISNTQAWNDLHWIFDDLKAQQLRDATEWKGRLIEYTTRMLVGVMPQAEAGDTDAGTLADKYITQLARLTGAYESTTVNLTIPPTFTLLRPDDRRNNDAGE